MNGLEQHGAQYATHGLLAFFGAIVHALKAHREGTSKTITDFFALVIMSSFSGVMFALVALQYLPEQTYLTTAIAGTGGYVGVEGMAILIAFLKKKFK